MRRMTVALECSMLDPGTHEERAAEKERKECGIKGEKDMLTWAGLIFGGRRYLLKLFILYDSRDEKRQCHKWYEQLPSTTACSFSSLQ